MFVNASGAIDNATIFDIRGIATGKIGDDFRKHCRNQKLMAESLMTNLIPEAQEHSHDHHEITFGKFTDRGGFIPFRRVSVRIKFTHQGKTAGSKRRMRHIRIVKQGDCFQFFTVFKTMNRSGMHQQDVFRPDSGMFAIAMMDAFPFVMRVNSENSWECSSVLGTLE